MQGLPVETNKRFSHYFEDDSGVTAHFTDGSYVRGSILVGADGASSVVRSQLLQGAHADVAPFVPISGSCTVTDCEQIAAFFQLTNTASLTVGKDIRVVIGLLTCEPDNCSVTFHYTVSYRPASPEAESAMISKADKTFLFEKVLELTQDIPQQLRQIICTAGSDSISMPQTRFLEFVPPETLPRGRVTLMGDAAHTMMPFKGAGANTALKDACELGQLLIGAGEGKLKIELLNEYSRTLCARGQKLVLASREASQDTTKMLGIDKHPIATSKGMTALLNCWWNWLLRVWSFLRQSALERT